MKLRALVLCACIVLVSGRSYASSGPPEPFFKTPSYIDLNYKAPAYTEFSYGTKTKFDLILQDYSEGAPDGRIDDANARAASEQQEHENYASYQEGAERFHVGAYDDALKIFTELRYLQIPLKEKLKSWFGQNSYSWVREASSYMIARCRLIIAQKNWDGYSNPVTGARRHVRGFTEEVGVDQDMLKAADAAYQLYLKDYPQGLYADSARNIRRKIFFLSGNQAGLDQELRRAMTVVFPASPNQPHNNTGFFIVTEFENYFHGEIDIAHDSPMLVAYAWLGDQKPQAGDITALEAREKDFAGYPGLFRYVHALGLYKLGAYQELIAKTPEQPVTNNILSLSTELLRAYAYAHLEKADDALAALSNMYNVAPQDGIELNIAELKLNQHNGLWLYSTASPIKTEKVLRSIAQFGLSDEELQKGLKDKEISSDKRPFLVDELARRYVLTKRFKELSLLLSDNTTGIFSLLKPAAATLARKPDDAQALVDTGEFIYEHYITPGGTFSGYNENRWGGDALSELLPHCPSCADFKERTKDYIPPIAFFHSAIQSVQHSGKKNEAEAKALHYIVRCERQGGEFQERCTWKMTWDRPKLKGDSAGKAAFMRLHKLYKDSPWTEKTPYYYD